METGYSITKARPEHLEALPDIESAAATMFEGYVPASQLGFIKIPTHELRPELETVVRDEAGRGLDRDQRVVMGYFVNAVLPTIAGGHGPCLVSETHC